MHRGQGKECLEREHAVAEGRVRLVRSEFVGRVGDPAGGESHEPFHEFRCRSRAFRFVQDRGGWGVSSGDVLPSGDGVVVSSPTVKMFSIRANSVSGSFELAGEPCGPCRAKSIT